MTGCLDYFTRHCTGFPRSGFRVQFHLRCQLPRYEKPIDRAVARISFQSVLFISQRSEPLRSLSFVGAFFSSVRCASVQQSSERRSLLVGRFSRHRMCSVCTSNRSDTLQGGSMAPTRTRYELRVHTAQCWKHRKSRLTRYIPIKKKK